MRGVILDLASMEDIDLAPLRAQLDQLDTHMLTSANQVAERIQGYDLVITNKVPLDREHIIQAEQLKLICVIATGTDVVDKSAAREQGVPVCNAVAYGVEAVAQHTLSLMLALHTQLLPYHQAVKTGRWQQSGQFCFLDYPIRELSGRSLGIIGYGHLGQAVALLGRAFGMQILVAERIGSETCREGRLPLDTVFQQADVISLHCPLTPETQHLINADRLSLMQPGSYLINTARGPLMDEAAVAAALLSGHLGGVATDVLTTEPPRTGSPLLALDLPNLIITPHIAWGSLEARQRIIEQTAENISAFVGGRPMRVVN
ncbi:D-2-hydroxyacid dehydrogenase [Pontibacter sp. JAM-7]|uniref:D-2-hydroxyacid dehydrogenase n=1 Tax=Pontibacter sp. JAM-7 TaxID=3366581 RepID=UPI003AF6E940